MRRDVARGWLTMALVVLLGNAAFGDDPDAEKRALADIKSAETAGLVESGAKLYKDGEYPLAAQRFDEALSANPGDEKALLFSGLTELRLDNPEKAYADWGKFEAQTKNRKLGDEIGKARTILLREVSERAAKDAVANEMRLRAGRTNPQLVAVATFKNAGSAEYAPLGKALAAMLIDNLSALPTIRVLERERVEALEEEAQLEGSGLVEKGTAVRAGKLLRAGRVTAGSHADWTASPTHLRLDALLVDVDSGKVIAEGKSEAFATEFFKLVPEVAQSFAAKLDVALAQLPPESQAKVTQQHTQSLEAALAFGRMLEALDRKDVEKALQSCKLLDKLDTNFDLMKKKCALIPLQWAAVGSLATIVEPMVFAEIGAVGGGMSYAVPLVAGLAAGIAGGTYAAVSGGGNGGGNGGNGGNNAPQLNGVGDRTVAAGQTASIDMDCRDPDGTVTSIASGGLPPGATLEQTPGNPSTGRYRQTTTGSQAGQNFSASFTCTDSGAPPQSVSRGATIHVVAPQSTPQPTAKPAPTPRPCRPNSQTCSSASQCCSGQCEFDFNDERVCCPGIGAACVANDSSGGNCCQPGNGFAFCNGGRCCLGSGSPCSNDSECCGDFCYFGVCQAFSTGPAN